LKKQFPISEIETDLSRFLCFDNPTKQWLDWADETSFTLSSQVTLSFRQQSKAKVEKAIL